MWEANLAPSDLAKFGKQHVSRTGLRRGVLCCPLDVLRPDFKCLPEECAVRCIAGTLLLGPTPLGIGQKTAPRRALLTDGTKIIDADERDLFYS